MIVSIHDRARLRITMSRLVEVEGSSAFGPYGFLVSCVIASSPAPAAKRVRLVASNSPDDDAFFTFPPDSRHYQRAEKRVLTPSL
jgi:hypothetical protein